MDAPHAADALALPAPAKINLFLHVIGRRGNGYHELESLVVFADVGDRLTAEPSTELTLEIAGPHAAGLDAGPENLVMRAARALQSRVDGAPGARMRLEKNLPVASGIGGGSADAATAIKLLARLWGVHPGEHDLSGLALDLGADVPVCLFGRPAMMHGIGERLAPVSGLPAMAAVLVNPGVSVSTPEVFNARSGGFTPSIDAAALPDEGAAWRALIENCHNDLEAPARALVPAVGEVIHTLSASAGCRLRRMSGSGATCFGIYDDAESAASAAAAISTAHPGWWVRACRFGGSSGG